MEVDQVVTVPAAAIAMGVSRIVLERAIKTKSLNVLTFYSGSNNGGFRLIPVPSLTTWLKDRKGYHEALKGGATKFHPWSSRKNPDTIAAKAVTITTTNKAA